MPEIQHFAKRFVLSSRHRVLLGNKALQTSILANLPSAAWQRPFASIFCASDSVEKAIAAAAAERLARQAERESS